MAKLTLKEILALTRAGFKAAEIKRMAEEEAEEPEPDTVPAEPKAPEDPEAIEPAEPESDEQDEPEAGPDYKALYEDVQKQLKEAQKKNVQQPGPEKTKISDEEYITKLVEEFY